MIEERLKVAQDRFDRLTPKERELLDQLLKHKSLKAIANDLGVTPSAVDQMLKSARIKLGAVDRIDAARIYYLLLADLRESNGGFAELGRERQLPMFPTPEPAAGSTFTFTFSDSAYFEAAPPPWRVVSEEVRAKITKRISVRIFRLLLTGLREFKSGFAELVSKRQLPLIQTAGPASGSRFTVRDMEKASPRDQVIAAVPAVSEAVRAEIAKRIAAGELIAYAERDKVIASRPATRDLATRRRELMDEFSGKHQAASKNTSAS